MNQSDVILAISGIKGNQRFSVVGAELHHRHLYDIVDCGINTEY